MTRNNFLKSIGVLLGVAVVAPFKLLKGKDTPQYVPNNSDYIIGVGPYDSHNLIKGSFVVHNPYIEAPITAADLSDKNEPLQTYYFRPNKSEEYEYLQYFEMPLKTIL